MKFNQFVDLSFLLTAYIFQILFFETGCHAVSVTVVYYNKLFCSHRSHQIVPRRRNNCRYTIYGPVCPLPGQAAGLCHMWDEYHKWPHILEVF
jgi:hypothetical protein